MTSWNPNWGFAQGFSSLAGNRAFAYQIYFVTYCSLETPGLTIHWIWWNLSAETTAPSFSYFITLLTLAFSSREGNGKVRHINNISHLSFAHYVTLMRKYYIWVQVRNNEYNGKSDNLSPTSDQWKRGWKFRGKFALWDVSPSRK